MQLIRTGLNVLKYVKGYEFEQILTVATWEEKFSPVYSNTVLSDLMFNTSKQLRSICKLMRMFGHECDYLSCLILNLDMSPIGRHFCSPVKAVRTGTSQQCPYSEGSNRHV